MMLLSLKFKKKLLLLPIFVRHLDIQIGYDGSFKFQR